MKKNRVVSLFLCVAVLMAFLMFLNPLKEQRLEVFASEEVLAGDIVGLTLIFLPISSSNTSGISFYLQKGEKSYFNDTVSMDKIRPGTYRVGWVACNKTGDSKYYPDIKTVIVKAGEPIQLDSPYFISTKQPKIGKQKE